MEQREGRIHRYKGHAVRKNLAMDVGERVLANGGSVNRPAADGGPRDPWIALFRHGEEAREEGQTELVPFWVYTGRNGEDTAKIERHVLALPLSRDSLRLAALRRSLAIYRMVFGQPRQEDLMEFLLEHFSAQQIEEWLGELRVDLGVKS